MLPGGHRCAASPDDAQSQARTKPQRSRKSATAPFDAQSTGVIADDFHRDTADRQPRPRNRLRVPQRVDELRDAIIRAFRRVSISTGQASGPNGLWIDRATPSALTTPALLRKDDKLRLLARSRWRLRRVATATSRRRNGRLANDACPLATTQSRLRKTQRTSAT
jgi:hypothetical protein